MGASNWLKYSIILRMSSSEQDRLRREASEAVDQDWVVRTSSPVHRELTSLVDKHWPVPVSAMLYDIGNMAHAVEIRKKNLDAKAPRDQAEIDEKERTGRVLIRLKNAGHGRSVPGTYQTVDLPLSASDMEVIGHSVVSMAPQGATITEEKIKTYRDVFVRLQDRFQKAGGTVDGKLTERVSNEIGRAHV